MIILKYTEVVITVGWVPETWISELPKRNGLLRQVEQGFSSFFAKFLANLMIFQSGAMPKAQRNFEKSSNYAKNLVKNEEKALFNLT